MNIELSVAIMLMPRIFSVYSCLLDPIVVVEKYIKRHDEGFSCALAAAKLVGIFLWSVVVGGSMFIEDYRS